MNDEDQIAASAERVNAEGVRRFGDHWGQAVAAVSRNVRQGVNPADVVREVLKRPDPAGVLFTAGREVLIDEATNGNDESERAYAKLRREERQAHRVARGRVY